jgi:hypothetical protein
VKPEIKDITSHAIEIENYIKENFSSELKQIEQYEVQLQQEKAGASTAYTLA